ncbi:helix-turn-helix domain-containing protein [Clostridium sp. YIM B02569]|uniref:helix-turn-helix domain-containing protein n=1 Tax=Clostridium sp. YIM B02569 TaxID=2911967 RepID=UPI001EEF3C77
MNLKLFRTRKKWSQCDLSSKSGVCRSVISKIENGHIDTVQVGLLKKLALALDIEVSYLL